MFIIFVNISFPFRNSWFFSTLSNITIPMHFFFEMCVSSRCRFMIQIYKENKNERKIMSIHALKRFFIVVWCVRLQLAINTRQFFMHIIIERIFFTYWNALWNVLYKLNGLMYLWWSLKWCRNFKTKKEEANEIVLDFFFFIHFIFISVAFNQNMLMD